jgi:glycosyltransferase involved in cell wall biosynthesis
LFEAMAAGKTIVSTAVDGCREVIEDGVTGVLVPRRDAQALAEALGRAADDPRLRADLGSRALAASRRYDVAECVRRMQDLYDEVLAGKGPA